jgi:hypothetical protein
MLLPEAVAAAAYTYWCAQWCMHDATLAGSFTLMMILLLRKQVVSL